MINPDFLLRIEKDVTLYPNQKGTELIMLSGDNTQYKATVLEAEANLALFLKTIGNKLTQQERIKLVKLISEFGSEKYTEGATNQFID